MGFSFFKAPRVVIVFCILLLSVTATLYIYQLFLVKQVRDFFAGLPFSVSVNTVDVSLFKREVSITGLTAEVPLQSLAVLGGVAPKGLAPSYEITIEQVRASNINYKLLFFFGGALSAADSLGSFELFDVAVTGVRDKWYAEYFLLENISLNMSSLVSANTLDGTKLAIAQAEIGFVALQNAYAQIPASMLGQTGDPFMIDFSAVEANNISAYGLSELELHDLFVRRQKHEVLTASFFGLEKLSSPFSMLSGQEYRRFLDGIVCENVTLQDASFNPLAYTGELVHLAREQSRVAEGVKEGTAEEDETLAAQNFSTASNFLVTLEQAIFSLKRHDRLYRLHSEVKNLAIPSFLYSVEGEFWLQLAMFLKDEDIVINGALTCEPHIAENYNVALHIELEVDVNRLFRMRNFAMIEPIFFKLATAKQGADYLKGCYLQKWELEFWNEEIINLVASTFGRHTVDFTKGPTEADSSTPNSTTVTQKQLHLWEDMLTNQAKNLSPAKEKVVLAFVDMLKGEKFFGLSCTPKRKITMYDALYDNVNWEEDELTPLPAKGAKDG